MNPVNHLLLSIVLFVLTITASSSIYADQDHPADQRIPFALTISGGVSLGAYESGSNWAFLRYLKQNKKSFPANSEPVFYDLVAVTGASAGSINALISAIAWCADEDKMRSNNFYEDTASNNLFYETWSNVGLDNLLPDTSVEEPYQEGDGLLSRKPFDDIIEKITKLMEKSVFIPHCEIPFGLTVTAEKSSDIKISGLVVQNQRQFIPLLLRVDVDGKAEFYSKLVNRFNPNYGHTIYLSSSQLLDLSATEYLLQTKQVVKAVLASSAFPVAFGRMVLEFCVFDAELTEKDDHATHSMHCPEMHRRTTGVFVDGGVFDNIPLGATMALAEGQRERVRRRVNYIYIDPGHRRYTDQYKGEELKTTTQKDLLFNIESQIGFLTGSVNTARKYELFKVLRSRDWDSQLSSKRDYLSGVITALKTTSAAQNEIDILMDEISLAVMKYESELQFDQLNVETIQERKKTIIFQMRQLVKLIGESAKGQYAEFELAQFVETFSYVESDLYSDRRLFLSSRYPLISGEYLGAFAAFFSRDFRDYDYYTGIYDAIIDIASTRCMLKECDFDQALDQVANIILDGSDGSDVHLIFNLLLESEKQFRKENGNERPINYQAKQYTASNANLKAVACSLLGQGGACQTGASVPKNFADFVDNLKTYQYNIIENTNQKYLAYAMENQKNWWRMPAYFGSTRLSELENDTDENGKKSILANPFKMLSEFSYALYKQENFVTWRKGFELGTGIGELGDSVGSALNRLYFAMNIYPEIVGTKIPFVSIRVLPYQRFRHDETSAVGSLGLVFWPATKQRFGIGPDLTFRWGDKDEIYSRIGLGANMQINVKSVKVSVGFRSIKNDSLVPDEHRRYMNIGWMF